MGAAFGGGRRIHGGHRTPGLTGLVQPVPFEGRRPGALIFSFRPGSFARPRPPRPVDCVPRPPAARAAGPSAWPARPPAPPVPRPPALRSSRRRPCGPPAAGLPAAPPNSVDGASAAVLGAATSRSCYWPSAGRSAVPALLSGYHRIWRAFRAAFRPDREGSGLGRVSGDSGWPAAVSDNRPTCPKSRRLRRRGWAKERRASPEEARRLQRNGRSRERRPGKGGPGKAARGRRPGKERRTQKRSGTKAAWRPGVRGRRSSRRA
jgi:hypothetical protein